MTVKADGTRPGGQSTLRIAASVLVGAVEPGWALLEDTADERFSGWTIYGPGDFTNERLPEVGEDDQLVEVSFSEVERVLPEARDLHDWGNGHFPLLMESWVHRGERKWVPWEDFSKYGEPGEK